MSTQYDPINKLVFYYTIECSIVGAYIYKNDLLSTTFSLYQAIVILNDE